MDWVFTPSPSWELTELDIDDFDVLPENNPSTEVLSGSDGVLNKLSEQKHSITPSSPSGPSKKVKVDSGDQHASCLVDGCRADLSGCREYHRRHRVCETHSKTPVVTILGREQRFCQQCSRFHSLGEFDEVKRSCRKRLDGHNRRRRKPRPESMYLNYGSFFTNHQGTKLLCFGGNKEKLKQRKPPESYTSFCSLRNRRFPFLLGVDSDIVNQPFSGSSFQQVVNTNASSGVLYLLSNSVSGPTDNLAQFNGSLTQHPGPYLPSRNVTGPTGGHANNQLIGMIHFRSEGLLESEAAQVLSFSWD